MLNNTYFPLFKAYQIFTLLKRREVLIYFPPMALDAYNERKDRVVARQGK